MARKGGQGFKKKIESGYNFNGFLNDRWERKGLKFICLLNLEKTASAIVFIYYFITRNPNIPFEHQTENRYAHYSYPSSISPWI